MTPTTGVTTTDSDGQHDSTDADFWRGLRVDELLAEIAKQMDQPADAELHEVVQEAVQTVVEDVMDRAVDQALCNKVDDCRAKAVFLTWLSWNLDHRLLPGGLR